MSLPKTQIDLAQVRIGVVSTCTMTGTTVTDVAGRMHFTDADVGSPIWIIGATDPIDPSTDDNGMLRTVIVSVTSDTVCETEDAATQTPDASANGTLFRLRGPRVNTFHVNNSLTTHDTFSCSFFDTLDPPLTLQPILAIVDSDMYFGGLIMRVRAVEVQGNDAYMEWQLDCVGWEVVVYGRTTGEPTDPDSPIAKPFAGQFDNELAKGIMKYLVVNALSSEGFDYLPLAADGEPIPSFKVSYAMCGAAFDNLITTGTQGTPPQWLHWYCTPDKKIAISDDTNGPAAPFDITDDSDPDDYTIGFEMDEDGDTFVNRVIIREGNQASDPIPSTFTGDGSTRNFSLAGPAAAEPTITVDGNPQTVGIQGVNTGKQWYWNLNSTGISQDPSETPVADGLAIVVTCPQFQAGFATYYNTDAIDFASARQGGTGYHESVQQQDNPNTLVDGQTYAKAIGQQFGVIPKKVTIKTFKNGLKVGMNILVDKARWGVNSRFVIDSVTVSTDGAWVVWNVTALGSPLIDWDYRATLARLRPPDDIGGSGGGGAPAPQAFWRVFDIHKTTIGDNVGPVLTVQETGPGIKITAVLRKEISADLVVRVNLAGNELDTITIPETTEVDTEVSISIKTKHLVKGQAISWDITGSDGSFDAQGVATVTVMWGIVNQVSIMGTWRGPWDNSATYEMGDGVEHEGSSYISLQDDNTGNEPEVGGTDFWDLMALKGADGDPGVGVPAGGTTGQVLTKLSDTDYDTDWENIPQPLTTVGDLLAYDGNPVRLPVGANDSVLTADSGEATGIKWSPSKVEAMSDGVSIGTRHTLNFIGLGGVVVTVVEDPDNNRVNIYISLGSSGGSSGSDITMIGFGGIYPL